MKKSGSSAPAKRTRKNAKRRKIYYSDIPESTDEELRRARRVGRPKSATTKQAKEARKDT